MEREAEAALSVAKSVLGELDLEQLLDKILQGARELTGARYAAIGVLGDPGDGGDPGSELARFIVAGIAEHERQAIGPLPRGRGVLGELIRDPRPLRLEDVGRHPRSYGFPDGHPAMSTFLGAPVFVRGQAYGNLYLTEKAGGEQFSDSDEQALLMLADIAGEAIENAERYTGVRQRREELERTVAALEVTTQITRAVGGRTDLDSILELVAKRGRAVVDARVLLIELLQDSELLVAAGAGELPAGLLGTRVALEGSVADHALRTRRTQRLTDELNRARFEEHGLGARGVRAEDGLIVPLIFRDRTYGVLLAVDRVKGGPQFSLEDLRLLEAFAASAATAVATGAAVASDLRRLAAVVQSSSDAIVTVDRTGEITSWNRGAEELYGIPSEDALGRHGPDVVRGASPEEREVLGRVLEGESVKRYETTRVRGGGETVEVSISVSGIRDANGRVVGAASITRDISEQKQMERVLSQTQRLDSLGALAGGVAHDMNNLLAVILNHADFALAAIEGQAAAEVGEIRAAAERAAALVRQLLLFARQDPQAGRVVLDAGERVAELTRILARTIGENIALHVDVDDSLWISADPAQLEQVIMNLAVNARDAMPDGGTLTITATRGEGEGSVLLRVADSGTGMPPEVAARAFEPFYTTKPTGSGTGLGLATVYGIVTKAGGRVEIDSQPGAGTAVIVHWPAVPAPAAHAAKQSPAAQRRREVAQVDSPPKRSGSAGRILLVEDERALREIAARLLAAAGYTVLCAADPAEAIQIAGGDTDGIDLLLTDVVLPGMSGARLAQRLRETRPQLPVLFTSGYVARPEDLPEAAPFVSKPFTREELLTAVGELLAPAPELRAKAG